MASAPLVQKLQAAGNDANRQDAGPTACAPTYTPPPEDVRTPEQVYDDSITDQVNTWLAQIKIPPVRYRKYCDSMSWDVFRAVKAALNETGVALPLQPFGVPHGRLAMHATRMGVVINGCPVLPY